MQSKSDSSTLFKNVFDKFVHSYIDHSNKDNMGLITYFDNQWDSPCLQKPSNVDIEDGQMLEWRPFLRTENATLKNLEEALEITIPAELEQLFCRYYSHDLNAQADHGSLTLLQVWNADDFDRLQKNLIAHVLMKRRLKQDDTLFFALTDEDDFILTVALSTGAVMLEEVGKVPQRKVADNLSEFIAQLTPSPVLVSL